MSDECECGASQQGAPQAAILAQDYERLRSLSMTEQGALLCREEHTVPESQRTGDARTPELQQCCFGAPVLVYSPCETRDGTHFLQEESRRTSLCSAWTIPPNSTQALVSNMVY